MRKVLVNGYQPIHGSDITNTTTTTTTKDTDLRLVLDVEQNQQIQFCLILLGYGGKQLERNDQVNDSIPSNPCLINLSVLCIRRGKDIMIVKRSSPRGFPLRFLFEFLKQTLSLSLSSPPVHSPESRVQNFCSRVSKLLFLIESFTVFVSSCF
ncbi:hypothetical protein NE237_003285 [Protea cynaroides]|uniref:Uncharacterized protein n=1 Tax=Protea cynaroides TaxID=273540 RepID=A0A9Q0KH32_9MAGN|nr:hypothetical protein NE237_003285 [Protea cynaroides]